MIPTARAELMQCLCNVETPLRSSGGGQEVDGTVIRVMGRAAEDPDTGGNESQKVKLCGQNVTIQDTGAEWLRQRLSGQL